MEVSKILKPKTKEEINYRLNLLKPDRKLLASAQFGRIDGVKDAIGKGADINTCTDDDPSTALDLAIGSSNFEIAKYLLNHGATVGNYACIPFSVGPNSPCLVVQMKNTVNKNNGHGTKCSGIE